MNNAKAIKVELLEGQIDLLLTCLQVYAFNLHNCYGVNKDDLEYDLKNALIFHTYESLVSQKLEGVRLNYDFTKVIKLKNIRKGIA